VPSYSHAPTALGIKVEQIRANFLFDILNVLYFIHVFTFFNVYCYFFLKRFYIYASGDTVPLLFCYLSSIPFWEMLLHFFRS